MQETLPLTFVNNDAKSKIFNKVKTIDHRALRKG